jgi:5-methylcytosine-specific restriction enzyme subunit McrC
VLKTDTYLDNQTILLTEVESQELREIGRNLEIDLTLENTDQGVVFSPNGLIGTAALSTRIIVIAPRHKVFDFDVILRMWHYVSFGRLDVPKSEVGAAISNFSKYVVCLFLSELDRLVNLRGSYIQHQEEISHFRGRMKFPQQVVIGSLNPSHFFCVFDEFTLDNPMNRLLLLALEKALLSGLADDRPHVIARLLKRFAFVRKRALSFSKAEIDAVINQAKSSALDRHYEFALSLAKIIVLDMVTAARGEGGITQAFLLNYNLLFQDFVIRILVHFTNLDLKPGPAVDYAYWTDENDVDHRRFIRPDIVHGYNAKEKVCLSILDVKNKVPPQKGDYFSPSDIYEVSFYSRILKAENVLLIYPLNMPRDHYTLNLVMDNQAVRVTAVFINLQHDTSADFHHEVGRFSSVVEALL